MMALHLVSLHISSLSFFLYLYTTGEAKNHTTKNYYSQVGRYLPFSLIAQLLSLNECYMSATL